MRITLTEKHGSATDEVKEYARERAEKLCKFYDGGVERIDCVLDAVNGRFSVEYIIHAKGNQTLVGSVTEKAYQPAIDLLYDKMGRQLTRLKERTKRRKGGKRAVVAASDHEGVDAADSEEEDVGHQNPTGESWA